MTRAGWRRTILALVVVAALVAVSMSVVFFGEPLPPFPADTF